MWFAKKKKQIPLAPELHSKPQAATSREDQDDGLNTQTISLKVPAAQSPEAENLLTQVTTAAYIGDPPATQEEPKDASVLVIMTGGTICMERSPEGFIPARNFLEKSLASRPSFNDGSKRVDLSAENQAGKRVALRSLRTPASSYNRRVRFCVLEFETLLDSSSMNADGWTAIAQSIDANYSLFDGFVVLHGTDSLAYTCSALSFMMQYLGKPIVFTGSQKPISELQNDGTDNLLGSLIIAGHFLIPEVCLFFNFKLFRGNRTTKVAAMDFNAFASQNYAPLATVSAAGTTVAWELVLPKPAQDLSLRTLLYTARVACLRIFPGIEPVMVRAVCQLEGLKGLVLETYGAGNADSSLTSVLSEAVERGIVIVNVTQCLSGNVSQTYAPATALGRAGVIFGQDMTTEAALTKLSYLLASPYLDHAETVRLMSVSIRGELTEPATVARFQAP